MGSCGWWSDCSSKRLKNSIPQSRSISVDLPWACYRRGSELFSSRKGRDTVSVQRLFTAGLLGVLLGGCVEYRHVPPETAEGQQCVVQCEAKRSACTRKAEDSQKVDKTGYDWQMMNYRACMTQIGSSSSQPSSACGGEPRSPSAPDTSHCRQAYNGCFTTCGGRIEKVPRQ